METMMMMMVQKILMMTMKRKTLKTMMRIWTMMMREKKLKRNSLKDMHWLLRVSQSRILRKETLMKKPKTLNWAQLFSDSLVERITEAFPEYEQFFQVHRQA